MTGYILYTYQTVTGKPVCHAYGPTSQEQAQATGENLQKSAATAKEPPLTIMVLPLEPMPV